MMIDVETFNRKEYFRVPSILFKFLAPERIDVLEKFLIKCTDPVDFSDVFDSFHATQDRDPDELNILGAQYYVIEGTVTQVLAEGRRGPSHQRMLDWVARSADLYPGYQILSVIWVDPFLTTEARSNFIDGFREQLFVKERPKVLCLTEDAMNRKMWDYYASGHRGFCLGLATNGPPLGTPAKQALMRVIYATQPSKGPPEVAIWRRWLVKHIDYAHEQEWRVLFWDDQTKLYPTRDGDIIHMVGLSPASIKQLIFGIRTTAATRSRLLDLVPSDVEVFECAPDAAGFSFALNRIR